MCFEALLPIITLGDHQLVEAEADCYRLEDNILLFMAATGTSLVCLGVREVKECLFLLVCSLMQCGFACDTIQVGLTLTHTLLFHRTRRTKSSNSLRLRSRYSASSVSSVIFCFGALKSCS